MIYQTNFDYELALEAYSKNKPHTPNQRMNNEFSYLFLWCESKFKKVLLSEIDFDSGYLDSISKTLGFEAKTSWIKKCDEKIENWWGKLNNISLELELNSKIYHQKLLGSIDSKHFICGEVCSRGDFKSFGDYFFRPEYGFAGMGSFRFKDQSFIPTSGVVTPFVEKKADLSCFYRNGKLTIYINEISKTNSFHGCYVFRDDNELIKDLKRRNIDYLILRESFEKVSNLLLKSYPNLDEFQMDAIYTADHKCLINEINYRKSMGQIALRLLGFFPDKTRLKFHLLPYKSFRPSNKWIILTPKNYHNYQFITAISF